jgi:hypothetical protein
LQDRDSARPKRNRPSHRGFPLTGLPGGGLPSVDPVFFQGVAVGDLAGGVGYGPAEASGRGAVLTGLWLRAVVVRHRVAVVPCWDVVDRCSDVVAPCSGVVAPCSDVVVPCSDVVVPCSDVVVPCSDVVVPCSGGGCVRARGLSRRVCGWAVNEVCPGGGSAGAAGAYVGASGLAVELALPWQGCGSFVPASPPIRNPPAF